MLAVIKTGGKQYKISPGDKIKIEKIDKEAGKDVKFDQVLLVEKDGQVEVGQPLVKKAKVVGTVLEQGKGDKIKIWKYKAKKRYQKRMGFRPLYTEVEIKSIEA